MVASVPIDYMHAVLEGVTRWLMKAWFEPRYHGSPFYIGRQVAEIDTELLKQHPPSEFSRPPRSIKKHFKYWKASELRNWLLYYSLPLLLTYLPSLYWHHYALLVCAMHIMLSQSITHAQIDAAEQMIKDFYLLLPELYGESSCTANAHLLSHLPKYVRLWGPLWTTSAFGFENKNGRLKHLFHGNSDIIHQLLFNIDVCYTFQQVHTHLLERESEKTLEYINRVSGMNPRRNMVCIGEHAYFVGQHKVMTPTREQAIALGHDGIIEVFYRMFKSGVVYHSTSYQRSASGKRDNTHCSYWDKADGSRCIGQIELFTTSPKPYAFIRQIRVLERSLIFQAGHPCRVSLNKYQEADLLRSYILPVNLSTTDCQLLAVPIDSIISKVVVVSVFENSYCIMQPNTVEHH